MRFIDLSVTLDNDTIADPPFQRPRIEYVAHPEGAETLTDLFPGLVPTDLADGQGWAVENVTLSTHNGTHVDAPWHYHPTMDGGAPASTIDELPLDWFYGPGVKIDFRDVPDGHVVGAEEIERQLEHIGHELQIGEIVLMNTSAGAAYGHEDYIHRGCGFGRDATLFLTDRQIRVVGTDAWSWMPPSPSQRDVMPRPATPQSSGKDTRPAETPATARSRSFTTSNSYQPPASLSAASQPRSPTPPPAGREPSRSCRTSTHHADHRRAKEVELTDHLGYEHHQEPPGGTGNTRNGSTPKTLITEQGEVRTDTPRSREGSFEPQIVRKRQQRFEGFDDKILALYVRGMSTRDISAHLREIYGSRSAGI